MPAVHFGIETEPTWATLRHELVQRIREVIGTISSRVGSYLALKTLLSLLLLLGAVQFIIGSFIDPYL